MGTNFYLVENACPHCRKGENLHIGKSSYGWCFSLATHPERNLFDLPDWLPLFESNIIVDEYGDELSAEAMVDRITNRKGVTDSFDERKWSKYYRDEQHFHDSNNSERGPNGLVRHKIGRHCAKHGDGSWDCMIGIFS